MASFTAEIQLIFNHFDALADVIQREIDIISLQAAEATVAAYRANARENTGAMRASAYITGNGESTYNDATAAARELNADIVLLSEERAPEHQVIAAVAAEYAAINEYGGHNHVGDGVFTQAVEAQRQWFLNEVQRLL